MNGRKNPNKRAPIEAVFERWDELSPTGKWSRDYKWIEVKGGETGTVWVYAEYVSEQKEPVLVKNTDYKLLKVRSRPFKGRINKYLKKGQTLDILNVVMGWGRSKFGWVDMDLVDILPVNISNDID